jgi:catechol 2,3-dioxygenase-like lactoylglutathione lyase family enzyme
MWGKPPFWILDNCVIEVRNLGTARDWYKKTFGFREASGEREDDSGRPFVDLRVSNDDTSLTLVERDGGSSVQSEHVIFFTKNLEKAREWLIERGVTVEAVASDSGGNRLFRFKDREGNAIEVCVEPG